MKSLKISLFVLMTILFAFYACEDNDDDDEKSTALIDFENFSLQEESHFPNQAGDSLFETGTAIFPYAYDASWGFMGGFAYSNMTDTETAGLQNKFSAYPGSGALNSQNYGVAYVYAPTPVAFKDSTKGHEPEHIYVTNATYAALSMKNGDDFAKKFGGEDGNDKDFFKLTITGIGLDGEETASIEVYLADYRFDDNSQDFILDEWKKVDLSALGTVKRIAFSLSSSDVGDFGMNTPAVFCFDNLKSQYQN